MKHLVFALLALVAGCVAPAGSKAVNPACVFYCSVEVSDAAQTPVVLTPTLKRGMVVDVFDTRSRTNSPP